MDCNIPFGDNRLSLLIGVTIFLVLFYLWIRTKAREIVTENPQKSWIPGDINRWSLLILVVLIWGFYRYFSNLC